MPKNLPNISKPVPDPTDPALIQPVSDAIEAIDAAIGAKPSTLTTTAKTIVPAINELKGKVDTLEADNSLLTGQPTSSHFNVSDVNVYKVGRLVLVSGRMAFTQSVPAQVETQIGTLPPGFAPSKDISIIRPQVNSTLGMSLITFGTSGRIYLFHYGSAAMPVNGNLYLDTLYISVPS